MAYHVYPAGDLIEHTDEDCVCGPRDIPVTRSDGSVGWVTVHNSLDGRELAERREKALSDARWRWQSDSN